jgi:hypothetical protein
LMALDRDRLEAAAANETLGVVLKAREDVDVMRGARLAGLIDAAG